MPAGDDGTLFRGNAFIDIDENGDILISPESGQQVTIDGTDYDTKADLTSAGGVLVSSQLPQLSITNVDVVADETERLNLDAEEGDFAIQQDNDTSYILSTNDPSVDSNWVEIDFDAVSAIAGQAINPGSVSVGGTSALISVAASGQTTLASGEAVVDTGESATDATYYLALGIDDPNADAKISGRLFWDDSAGTYKIDIQETETSVGNPTVNYDILRVR
jgi:hypothetical protein